MAGERPRTAHGGQRGIDAGGNTVGVAGDADDGNQPVAVGDDVLVGRLKLAAIDLDQVPAVGRQQVR